jgi:hypothetical protein
MNLQIQPRIDPVLPHPHSTCALHDTHTLDLRLRTGSSDRTKLTDGPQLPGHRLSEHHAPPSLVAYTN